MVSLLIPALALVVPPVQPAPGTQTAAPAMSGPLLSTPAVNGNTVVFGYAGDLWVTDLQGSATRRLTSSPGLETTPKLSPDGQTVAFVGMYEGGQEVYTMPITGGEPVRLTYEAGGKPLFGFTPDGSRVAYGSSARNFTNRQAAMYTVARDGGPSKNTVLNEVASLSYFPDGEKVAFVRYVSEGYNWRRYRGGNQGRVAIYDFKTNSYRELPTGREQNYTPMAVDGAVFYTSDKEGGTLNLYRHDVKNNRTEQLTKFTDIDVRAPSTDGKTIAFERGGSLYLYDVTSKATRPLRPTIASENLGSRPTVRNVSTSIEGVAVNDAGTRAFVSARGDMFSVGPKTGEAQNLTASSGARDRGAFLSPDNRTLYYLSDRSTGSGPGENDVYARDLATNIERKLGMGDIKIQGMTLSPDGGMLAVTNTEGQLTIVDVASGRRTPLARAFAGVRSYSFSPDSRMIATVETEKNELGRVYIQPVTGGKKEALTSGAFDDLDIDFDPSGKYLYLASVRAIQPGFGQYEFSLKIEDATKLFVLPLRSDTASPFQELDEDLPAAASTTAPPANPGGNPPPPGSPERGGEGAPPNIPAQGSPAQPQNPPATPARTIDVEGAEQRLIEIPLPAGNYQGLLGVNGGFVYFANGFVNKFTLMSKSAAPIAPLTGPFAFSPKRTKLILGGPGSARIIDVAPGQPPTAGNVDLGGLTARVDPREEWRQIFWEVWRFQRDTFYDPSMGNQDWRAIGNRYAADVERARHRSDLTLIIRRLIAELGTGHAYVQGNGDMGMPPTPGPSVAYLGANYTTEGNAVKFGRIFRGLNYASSEVGPLGTPGTGVKEGDTLVAIDGQAVSADEDPGRMLLGKAGRTVVLTVRTGNAPERRIRVKPVASEYRLRYTDWVETNRRKVSEMSNGRIGYMHISDTGVQGTVDFVRGFYPQVDKDAMVVDERWNGGGFIQPWFVDTLNRRVRAGIQRPGFPDTADAVAIEGPMVMLINGYAGSGGDLFPYMFRQAKRGELIGTRTWGGLVGISGGLNTVDGQNVTSPGFALFNPETNEIIAENTGIDPDIEVDLRPDLVAKGRDPQLEKAVEVLLEKLKNAPPRKVRKDVPRVGRQGRIGG